MSSFVKSDYKEEIDRLKAKFTTTKGDFEVELYAKECPETVWSFVNLAEGRQETLKEGPYYNGIIFHRVIAGFMIQVGCPLGNGTGGPGYGFDNECTEELTHSSEGVLSMANTGAPGSNGSQFFITLGPTPHLNGKHTVFGKIIAGMDTIKKIGTTATGMNDRPVDDIKIEAIEIIRG